MNVIRRHRTMTREEFFPWANAQNTRHEFDGFQPVAMTGGTFNHSLICHNIALSLGTRLKGSDCQVLSDAGLATIGDAVRYSDALVTCSKVPGTALVIPGVLLAFEVLSPSSGRTDRIEKLREYHAVASIRRYVILEYASIGLTVFSRHDGEADWLAMSLTGEDTLQLPEIKTAVPVAEFYSGVDLPGASQPTP